MFINLYLFILKFTAKICEVIGDYGERNLKFAEKLADKKNWTPELRYVHKSRLIVGFVFGFLWGFFWLYFIKSVLLLV